MAMKKIVYGALGALTLVLSQQASAQVALRGVKADAQVGYDRFYSEGNHHNRLGYGGAVGIDGLFGNGLVLGVEGTLFTARNENITRDGPGIARRKSFEEYGVALRAGFMTTPSTLIYARGGIVRNEQRKFFDADTIGTRPAIFGDYYNHYHTAGYTVGGGVEQMLGQNLYLKAEGRYSNYRTNSSRLTGILGLGLMFGASAPAVVDLPPPPPPPPAPVVEAPATQTCPDGSVILATDVCPAPPAPPAPPEPTVERG
jgi:outer membrane immunogenic protein